MPEGDTIHKLAAALAAGLEGRRLLRGELRRDPSLALAGRRVERVEALGKHLFVRLDGELELRSHLGMHGSWHRYAPGEAWQRPARQAALVLETEQDVFVCFLAAEVECLRPGSARAADARRRLGPDLAAEAEPDLVRAVAGARRLAPETPLLDVLLDQSVACGLGNVYKSEVLFLERLDPRTPVGDVGDEQLAELFARGRALLRANLGAGRRVTRAARDGRGALWVYGRRARPCLECGAPIRSERLGRGRRSTYWCPACQTR